MPPEIVAAAEAKGRKLSSACAECGAWLPFGQVYHPYAFCVLVKAGLDPEAVVHEAVRHYEKHGWPENEGLRDA